MRIPICQVILIDQATVIIVLIVSSVKIAAIASIALDVPTALIVVTVWIVNYFTDVLIVIKPITLLTWNTAAKHTIVSFVGTALIAIIFSVVHI